MKGYLVLYKPIITLWCLNRFNIELVKYYIKYHLYQIIFFDIIEYMLKIIDKYHM